MANPLEVFRVLAPEFASVDDATAQTWLDLTAPLVSRKRFGELYAQALALLAAHRMKTAGAGSSGSGGESLGELGGVGAAFKIASYSSGGESISFNSGTLTAKLSPDAEYSQTTYGVQYLSLRELNAIAIINAGEAQG